VRPSGVPTFAQEVVDIDPGEIEDDLDRLIFVRQLAPWERLKSAC